MCKMEKYQGTYIQNISNLVFFFFKWKIQYDIQVK